MQTKELVSQERLTAKMWASFLKEVTLTKQSRPVRVDLGQNSKGKGIYLTKGLFL